MNLILNMIQKIFVLDKTSQPIGLTQLKEPVIEKKKEKPSIKNKNIKLSDLMRG